MRSSTTPPVASSQHSVYCALPAPTRSRSLVRDALTYAAAPGPRTTALPRWLTSKTPTASRTAVCSLTTPWPAYSSGIDHPPNSASLAPSATCRSCNGESRRSGPDVGAVTAPNLPQPDGRTPTARVATVSPTRTPARRSASPSYTLSKGAAEKSKADVVAIGVVRTARGLRAAPGGEGVAAAYGRKFAPLLSTLGFHGRPGEVA